MSKYFKRKKGKEIQQQAPRSLEDIKKAYNEVSARAANAQYLVYIHNKELEQINEQLMFLNQEAGARQQLDAASAQPESTDAKP